VNLEDNTALLKELADYGPAPESFLCPKCLQWRTGFSQGEAGWCTQCMNKHYPRVGTAWYGKGIYHLANLPCIETGRIIDIPDMIEMDTMPVAGRQYKACPICFPPQEDDWSRRRTTRR
jgi:hypothetical protein